MRKISMLLLGASLGLASCAQADPAMADSLMDERIQQVVRSYLLENPEILREMSVALQEKERAEAQALTGAAIRDLEDRIKNDPRDVSLGPEDAKVTLVEFFDYNCGFCKRSTEWLRKTLDTHGDDVRVVFKEIPILDRGSDGSSRNAARAALAAARQGKYPVLHFSLMNERALTPERVDALAEAAGLDMDKFREDMKDPAIDAHIDANIELAREIPDLTGTPFFIINDQWLSGADSEKLDAILAQELG